MAEKIKPKSREEIPYLFKDSFITGEKGNFRKAIAFPIALLLHVSIVAAMIVIPLLNTGNLPQVEVYSAFLAPPPPP
ncbi:MAG: hypothetical protein V3S65_03735, partial [Candidatus Aminicenantaceae bacterium]